MFDNFKSGFIGLIGAPNVGKSTLLNQMLGEKVSITSAKPQTTRNRILGVVHQENAQLVMLDTPGIHSAHSPLNKHMVDVAMQCMGDVDLLMFVVDASKPDPKSEQLVIKALAKQKMPVILALNKIDLIKKENLLPLMAKWATVGDFKAVVPVSAKTGEQVDKLVFVLKEDLPLGPPFFPEDSLTDMPERFVAAEMIREKVFRMTSQEIPYSVAVTLDSFTEQEEPPMVKISAVIHVERDSQKGIIIGKQGAMLKKIGTSARKEIERMVGVKVFLKLFVRVEKKLEYGYKSHAEAWLRMILSFHPIIVGDENRLCAGRDPDEADRAAIKKAKIVILPQGCRESLYTMAVENCDKIFPDYQARFQFPGKVGQIRLFQETDAPHPRTFAYDNLEAFMHIHRVEPSLPLRFPIVFKLNWGGESSSVYLLQNHDDVAFALAKARACQETGQKGFLFQEYIETKGRSLRVAVINETLATYWRVAPESAGFGAGVAHGARVDQKSYPDLMKKGEQAVRELCAKTGINLAGFDLVFDLNSPDPAPQFLEVNYFFRQTGPWGVGTVLHPASRGHKSLAGKTALAPIQIHRIQFPGRHVKKVSLAVRHADFLQFFVFLPGFHPLHDHMRADALAQVHHGFDDFLLQIALVYVLDKGNVHLHVTGSQFHNAFQIGISRAHVVSGMHDAHVRIVPHGVPEQVVIIDGQFFADFKDDVFRLDFQIVQQLFQVQAAEFRVVDGHAQGVDEYFLVRAHGAYAFQGPPSAEPVQFKGKAALRGHEEHQRGTGELGIFRAPG